jgi:hypothetical protein
MHPTTPTRHHPTRSSSSNPRTNPTPPTRYRSGGAHPASCSRPNNRGRTHLARRTGFPVTLARTHDRRSCVHSTTTGGADLLRAASAMLDDHVILFSCDDGLNSSAKQDGPEGF